MCDRRAIWVLAEAGGARLEKVTLELLGDAKKLAAARKTSHEVVVLGSADDLPRLVEELRPYQPDAVHLIAHPALAQYTTETHLEALLPLVIDARPLAMFVAATANGRDLAPRLAMRAGMALFPHTLTVRPAGADQLEVTRVSHGGQVHLVRSCPARESLLITMKPGVADAPPANPAAPEPRVTRVEATFSDRPTRVRVLEQLPADPRVQDLREAERIVAGGRGVGGPEGFRVIEALADALHAAVAASRVAVDLGWVSSQRQVGQTGKTVAPQLYLAAGISGASHHLMGMRGSEKIVAINSDRTAPIFSVSHFGAVGDLHQILPALTRRLEAGLKE